MIHHPDIKPVKLLFSGTDFFVALEKAIDAANEIIHLQTYIFEEDETGTRIASALIRAAKRGVAIFILVDAFGSKELSIGFIRQLQQTGINFRFFSPLFSKESIYAGRRLHHKVVVIDRFTAIVGGINIGDRYHGSKNEPAWLDYAVLIENEICIDLHTLCEELYHKRRFRRSRNKVIKKNESESGTIRFNRNDWIKGKNDIYKSCLRSFANSKDTIVIICSYFLPGYRYRKALRDARKRGIRIKVILAGKSDVSLVFYAEKYLYRFLAKNGIEIYEWPTSVMHAKAIAVDNNWTTIGSYNMNYLSHYRSIELNVELTDPRFSTVFLNHINEITTTGCVKINSDDLLRSQNVFIKMRNATSYFFYRAIMKIFLPNKNLKKK